MVNNQKRLKFLLCLCISTLVGSSYVSAYLTNSVSIIGTGRITQTATTEKYQSEIRAMFIHSSNTLYPDWPLIVDTLSSYGVNVIVVEAMGNSWGRYPSDVIDHWDYDLLTPAVQAAHSKGIKLYVSMNVIGEGRPSNLSLATIRASTGDYGHTMCPTKQASRARLKAIVEELVTKWDIDGFMFDYIRYCWADECICPECQSKFKADTGLTDAVFPNDVAGGGRYKQEFMEWRTVPVNELVRDMRSWMLAIKPDLEFSAAVWRWPPSAPTYWRYWLGQDAAFWVKEGWLDWVSPMIYTDDLTELENTMNSFFDILIGSKEGKIPIVPFIDTCVDAVSTPENFAQRVNKLREMGADGWIIWRYGGPGDGEGSNAPDIRNYLSIIDMPGVFSLGDIQVSPSGAVATIIWTTDLPATSKVEYSTSPLFNESFEYVQYLDFHYWDIDYAAGTVVEDNKTATNHSITLTGLFPETKYYFRVQSQDPSGIATSKVLTFTTGESL